MLQESIVIPKTRRNWLLVVAAGLLIAVAGALLLVPEKNDGAVYCYFPLAPPPKTAEKAPALVPVDTAPLQPDALPGHPPEEVTKVAKDAEVSVLPGIGSGDSEQRIFRVGGKVKRPVGISQPQPVFTELDRRTMPSSPIILEAVINREGHVEDIRVLKPLGGGRLTEKVIEALRKWRFSPATLDGHPVAVYYTLTVNIRLD